MLSAPVRPYRRRCKSSKWARVHDQLAREVYGFSPAQDSRIETMCADLGNQLEADRLAGWDMPAEQKQQIRET